MGCITETLKASDASLPITFCDLGNDVDKKSKKKALMDADAVIFMLDAVKYIDSKKYREDVNKMLKSYLDNKDLEICVFLILANQLDKCEEPERTRDKIEELLDIASIRSHIVEYRGTSVKNGLNVRESEKWIVSAVLGVRYMLEVGKLKAPISLSPKKKATSSSKKLYSQAFIAPDVFRLQLYRGTLPLYEFPDIIRSIFCFLVDALSSSTGNLDECLNNFYQGVHVVFQLPGSISSNITALHILIAEIGSCLQKFILARGKLPTEFDFSTVFLSDFPHLLQLDTLWKFITPTLLLSEDAWHRPLLPDLQMSPWIWAWPTLNLSCVETHPHLIAMFHCFHHLRRCRREGNSRSQAESTLQNMNLKLGLTQLLFWMQILDAALSKHPMLLEDSINFLSFSIICPEVLNPLHWKKYYSPSVWESQETMEQFILPDLQALPNVLLNNSNPSPSPKKLLSQFKRPFSVSESMLQKPTPEMNHLEFIFVLHDRLKPLGPFATCEIHKVFNFLLESGGPTLVLKGCTHLYFWTHIILLLMLHQPRNTPTSEFLETFPILLWSDAWSIYYTLDTVWSKAGMTTCLQPDLHPFPILHLLSMSQIKVDVENEVNSGMN
ncbi:hypothetical protein HMI55_002157 [Coelomomyces lativittatus]|nr:hypothetical protein HMI55_002157 [Coelomomyces lativittatus]